MYEFHFEGYSPELCEVYLKRIGAEYDGNPTLENLNMLIGRHQKSVPFENLALIMNYGTVNPNPDALFQKIVTEHRGGFCFELNGAFLLLLKGLGYDAVGCMARVGVPFVGELLHTDHMGVLVRLDGEQYYLDVGMGGPKADFAVNMDGTKQTHRGQTYWVEDTFEGWKMLKNEGSESDGCVIIFAPIPLLPMDFYGNCAYLVNRGETMFHTMRMVNICTEDGYVALTDQRLKIFANDETVEREFSEEEFPEILKKYFGMEMRKKR